MLSSMPQAATDALYEARQQRRKQLLKEQMAKKLWEDNYEGTVYTVLVFIRYKYLHSINYTNLGVIQLWSF